MIRSAVMSLAFAAALALPPERPAAAGAAARVHLAARASG